MKLEEILTCNTIDTRRTCHSIYMYTTSAVNRSNLLAATLRMVVVFLGRNKSVESHVVYCFDQFRRGRNVVIVIDVSSLFLKYYLDVSNSSTISDRRLNIFDATLTTHTLDVYSHRCNPIISIGQTRRSWDPDQVGCLEIKLAIIVAIPENTFIYK